MRIVVPDYYEKFHCLAGDCPHSCCEKWEVVLDEAHVRRYEETPGALGDKLRASMQRDGDGDVCFLLNGSRCPFLDGDNLCEIHRALGADATSVTCQEHPRFTEDYGAFREITLSASCPAANALLLGSGESLTFRELETAEPEEVGDEWLTWLLPLRERLTALLTDRALPMHGRLGNFLRMARAAQACLDGEDAEALDALETPAGEVYPALPGEVWAVLRELEDLEPDWRELLAAAETAPVTPAEDGLLERIAVYFTFRYLLKTVNDGDLLSRAQFVVLAVLTVERLGAVCGLAEALRRFSCEIEHSDENLEALLDAFRWEEALAPERFLAAES